MIIQLSPAHLLLESLAKLMVFEYFLLLFVLLPFPSHPIQYLSLTISQLIVNKRHKYIYCIITECFIPAWIKQLNNCRCINNFSIYLGVIFKLYSVAIDKGLINRIIIWAPSVYPFVHPRFVRDESCEVSSGSNS